MQHNKCSTGLYCWFCWMPSMFFRCAPCVAMMPALTAMAYGTQDNAQCDAYICQRLRQNQPRHRAPAEHLCPLAATVIICCCYLATLWCLANGGAVSVQRFWHAAVVSNTNWHSMQLPKLISVFMVNVVCSCSIEQAAALVSKQGAALMSWRRCFKIYLHPSRRLMIRHRSFSCIYPGA